MSIKRQLMTMAGILLVGALANSGLVLYQVSRMRSDALVVNLAGTVRGQAQRVLRLELEEKLDEELNDQLITEVGLTIDSLLQGDPARGIPSASDGSFRAAVSKVQESWTELKRSILAARKQPARRAQLNRDGDEFYEKSNTAVDAAERLAESKIQTLQLSQFVLSGLNLFVVAAIVMVSRKMTTTLNETIGSLASTSAQLASTAEMQQRVGAEQATATNETTTTVEELGASSRMSAEQADRSASEVRQSLSLAEQGASAVQQSQQAMGDLKDNVNNLAQNILSLSSQIDQIREISKFVGDLAGQTNMLALNAAVEAAHAGEHGKGFGVVAAEIRKLADESTRSMSRIHGLVTDIHQATNTAVMAAEHGTKVVDHVLRLARQTGDVFGDLTRSINRTAESTLQISLNAKEQASAIHQVVEAIESLNTGAREAADGLRQSSLGIHTLDQAVRRLQTMVGVNHD